MEKKLITITPEEWELMRENRKALMIDIGREDWMFEIAGLYKNGEIELYLCPVPTTRRPITLLKPLTSEEWEFTTERAQEILNKLIRARSPAFLSPPWRGGEDLSSEIRSATCSESGKGGD